MAARKPKDPMDAILEAHPLMPALQAWFDEHHPNGIMRLDGEKA